MGIHYVNGDLVGDGLLDPKRPESLLYELKDGRMQLAAVEYVVIADAWNAKSMDNAKAKKLTSEWLTIQADEVKLMQSYVPKLDKVLPATKVARYLQIENKIRSIVKYEAAGAIPLVPEK